MLLCSLIGGYQLQISPSLGVKFASDREDGSSMFLRNIDTNTLAYTELSWSKIPELETHF